MKSKNPEIMEEKNTVCVHAGTTFDSDFSGVNTPIYTSTASRYPNSAEQVWYPRYFNTPNQMAVAQKMARLENGEAALVFSSGMAAVSTTLLGLCRQGDHILFQDVIYGGTLHFVKHHLLSFGIDVDFFSDEKEVVTKIRPETKLIYIETPSNPLLGITNILAISRIAKEHGIISIIDSTFATPINQNPLDLNIDIVIHSGTKYLGGHSDLCCGVVVSSHSLIARITEMAKCLGGSLDANSCYLLERSLKTLAMRVKRHNENAQTIAEFLNRHPQIKKVYYPGLSGHPGHEIAKKQMPGGFGGMLAFELGKPGSVDMFLKKLKIVTPAVSLGGVESLICQPAQTSHASLPKVERMKLGITDELLRLSVGIEDVESLLSDLEQALLP